MIRAKKLFLLLLIPFLNHVSLLAQKDIPPSHCYKNEIYELEAMIPSNDSYDDLQFLKSKLGNKRIVLLGESGHGDGASFEAKIRLIKFLVDEMGYSTLAFEGAPLLGLYYSAQQIENGTSSAEEFRKSWYALWSKSQQCQSLFDYIDEKEDLNLLGIDCQYDNPNNRSLIELISLFHGDELGDELYDGIDKEKLTAQLGYFKKCSYDAEAKANVNFKYLARMMLRLIRKHKKKYRDSNSIIVKELKNYKRAINNMELLFGTYMQQNVSIKDRDACMASNIDWYIKNHPEEKIIIWAANFHIAKNLQLAAYKPGDNFYQQMKPLGHRLYQKYPKQSYAIAMTASEGETGLFRNNTKVEVDQNTWEYHLAKQTHADYAYIDFEAIRQNKSCGKKKFQSNLLNKKYGQWFQLFDAVIYIRKMEANKMIQSSYNPSNKTISYE